MCVLNLEKRKKWKNGANSSIRQGNENLVDVSNLIHRSRYTLAHAPICMYHCILGMG